VTESTFYCSADHRLHWLIHHSSALATTFCRHALERIAFGENAQQLATIVGVSVRGEVHFSSAS